MKLTSPASPGIDSVLDFGPLLSQVCKTMTLMEHFSENIKNADLQVLQLGNYADNFKEVFGEFTEIFTRIIENMDHLKQKTAN